MTRQIALRPKALDDLSDIWDYTVETWGTAQAQRYLRGLDTVFQNLGQSPEVARLRQEFTPPFRILPYGGHVVLYNADETTLDIIRVVHRQANWSQFLSD